MFIKSLLRASKVDQHFFNTKAENPGLIPRAYTDEWVKRLPLFAILTP